MSGGVDSSVTAALLREEGHDVIGMTMQLYPADAATTDDKNRCAITDAAQVCDFLGIQHVVVDVQDQFDRAVVDNFQQEYLSGRTPNPCVLCNENVKFGSFLTAARSYGVEKLATGHYVRIDYDENTQQYLLRQGIDRTKDQSYMLYRLDQEQLSFLMTPLGNYTKKEVRKRARTMKLPVAERPESQDLCFSDYRRHQVFMQEEVPVKAQPGIIRDTHGAVRGRHKGLVYYTIGQRRGLGIAAKRSLYVLRIDAGQNEIIVGYKEEVFHDGLHAGNVHFIAGSAPRDIFSCEAKIRYLHPQASAQVTMYTPDAAQVDFEKPQEAITPGQSVVFYKGDTVLGGGFITEVCDEASKNNESV